MPRVLGLDVGSKTIGVAVTDELGVAAHPVRTLQRRGTARDVAQVRAIADELSVAQVVVGLPLEGDGSEGHRAARVRVFMEALAASGLSVEECDERFSTVEATETLLAADLSRKKRKKVVDRAAAVVILRRWLTHEC